MNKLPQIHRLQNHYQRVLCLGLLFLGLTALAGCEEETIHTYVAPKASPPPVITPPRNSGPVAPTRMLAAILRQPEVTWFFKLTASPSEAAGLREAFGKFVASTNFEGDQPSWEIPDDWNELPGKPMRFTTFQIGSNGPEVSVSTLPNNSDEVDSAVANINRWRGQLGLAGLTAPEYLQALAADDDSEILPEEGSEIVSITTPAGKATLIDLLGEMSGSRQPPFANRSMGPASGSVPETPKQLSSSNGPKLKPADHWKQGRLNSFRIAAYELGEGDNKTEITLSTAGGDLLGNVNRWRGQVELTPWSADELATQKKTLVGQGYVADYVELIGPTKAILGAIINHQDRTWFVKLTGPKETAEEEQQNFEEFVKTIEF